MDSNDRLDRSLGALVAIQELTCFTGCAEENYCQVVGSAYVRGHLPL